MLATRPLSGRVRTSCSAIAYGGGGGASKASKAVQGSRFCRRHSMRMRWGVHWSAPGRSMRGVTSVICRCYGCSMRAYAAINLHKACQFDCTQQYFCNSGFWAFLGQKMFGGKKSSTPYCWHANRRQLAEAATAREGTETTRPDTELQAEIKQSQRAPPWRKRSTAAKADRQNCWCVLECLEPKT
eukprot:SAG11_NODE_2082_length_3849_cov_7.762667_4_plen_185_part_00